MRSSLLLALSCLLLLLMVAALAGCSSPAPVTVPTLPAAPPTQAPAQLATPEPVPAPDSDWARIQKAGVLRVASPLDNPPFNMYNEKFEPDGFDIALMTELAQRLGLKVEFSDYAFDGLLDALQRGQVDAVIAAMAITDDRRKQVDFTQPYWQSEDAVLAAPGSTITSVGNGADLASHKVGVQRGTVYETWIDRNLVKTGEMPDKNLMIYSQPADALAALNAGAVDLVVVEAATGQDYQAQGKAKVVGKSMYIQDFAIALPKGSELQAQLNRTLARVSADGTLARLVETYLRVPAGEVTPLPTEAPTEAPVVATATPQPTAIPAPYNDWGPPKNANLDLTIPDNTVVKPGQSFKKGWRLMNTGTLTWSPEYRVVYSDGVPNVPATQMGGLPTLIGEEVPRGATHDVYVTLVAPTEPGTYRANWQIEDASGKAFGKQFWMQIVVPAPTPVTPPTATPVPGIAFTWGANPNPVQAGGTTTLSWTVTGVVNGVWLCLQSNQQCEGVGQKDSRQRQPPYSPVTNYELRVLKTDGQTAVYTMPVSVTQPVNAPYIQNFSASAAGTCANLWWQVSDNPRRIAIARLGMGPAKDGAAATDSMQDCPGVQGSITYELQVWAQGTSNDQPPTDRRQQTVVLQGPPPCQPQTVTMGDQNCGSPVNFCQGSTLMVVLTASGGSGYVWEQSANLNASILRPQGGPNVQQGSGPGAPDTYTWEYRAVGQGQTNLSFDLKRGAEAPIQSCGFPVGVQ